MAEYVSKSTLYALCGQRGITYLHVSDIDNMPAADVAPVVHGKWVLGDHRVRCSVCNTRALINYDETDYFNELSPYCPRCGAKMKKG